MKIQRNILLSQHTTFKTGGPADFFCEIEKKEDLLRCFDWIEREKLNFFCLGNGSNLLVNDSGFRGAIIKITSNKTVWKDNKSTSASGTMLSKLINEASERDMGGLEWAFGIPATLGGAVKNNAGAFGGEMAKSVESVEIFNSKNKAFKKIGNKECGFSYRKSVFKENNNWIVWQITLIWEKKEREKIIKNIASFLEKRKEKQPLEYPSAGSFFRNPSLSNLENSKRKALINRFIEKELAKPNKREGESENDIREKIEQSNMLPAAYLIEEADLKGRVVGGAQVSNKHANFIVNTGNAKTEDIVILASLIKQKVRTEFGIQLHEEVEYVGFN